MRTAMRQAVTAAAARSGTTPRDLALAIELLEKAEGSPVAARELEGQLFKYGSGVAGLCALGLAGMEAEAEGEAGAWDTEVRGLQGVQDSGAVDVGDAEPPPVIDSSAAEAWLQRQDREQALKDKIRGSKDATEAASLQAELQRMRAPPAPRPIAELLPGWQAAEEE